MSEQSNFETTECSRCNGSGRHSYTQMWLDTCFQCGSKPGVPGTGRMLTKAGRAAREAWLAANSVTTTASDVVAGDTIVETNGTRRTVVAIESADSWVESTVSGVTTRRVIDTAIVVKHGVYGTMRMLYAAADVVTVWRPIIDAPPKADVNTDRRAEMRAYVKSAAAAALAAGRTTTEIGASK